MENKKTKLTISSTAKKSIKNIEIAKTQGKNAVVIEKSKNNFTKKSGSFRPSGTSVRSKPTSSFNRGATPKPSFSNKTPPITNDFEKRKLAEQRATKRLKGENEGKKNKSGTKKKRIKVNSFKSFERWNWSKRKKLSISKKSKRKRAKKFKQRW